MDIIIGWLVSWFSAPVSGNLRKTIDSLTKNNPPDLAGEFFQQQYAQMWGVASVIGVPLIVWHIIKALGSDDRAVNNFREAAHIFLMITCIAIVIPPVLYMCQTISGWATDIALSFKSDVAEGKSWYEKLTTLPTLDGPAAFVGSALQWFFGFILQIEAFIVENLVLITGGLILIGYILRHVGRMGQNFLNIVLGLALVSFASKPLMVLTLVLGTNLIDFLAPNALIVAGLAFLGILTVGIASAVPIWAFGTYRKKFSHILGGQTDVSGSRVDASNSGHNHSKLAAAAAGGTAALVQAVNMNRDTPGPSNNAASTTPAPSPTSMTSTSRRIAHSALTSAGVKAAAKSHPVAAVALHGAAILIKPAEQRPASLTTQRPTLPPNQGTSLPPTQRPLPPRSPTIGENKPEESKKEE